LAKSHLLGVNVRITLGVLSRRFPVPFPGMFQDSPERYQFARIDVSTVLVSPVLYEARQMLIPSGHPVAMV
jgi:hypothetical protein